MSVTATYAIEQLPSERDWNVYQQVRVQQWSTRATAKEFDLSQTLVCQIVQRTSKFISESIQVPSKETAARQLAAGRQLAAERIDHLISETMRCFRKSQSPLKSTSESATRRCTTTRTCHGDLRYLQAAARLAVIASTLPPPLIMLDAADFETVDESAADHHPEEDCSAMVAEQPAATEEPASPRSATATEMLGCVEKSRREKEAAHSAARPVQPPASQFDAKAARREKFFQAG